MCFLSDEVKAISCTQCGKEFPRRKPVIPFDIVLSHEEKWMYPDANNPGEKLPSSKYTTKFYCVDARCVKARFPYFETKLYLETKSVEQKLKDSHRTVEILNRIGLGRLVKPCCKKMLPRTTLDHTVFRSTFFLKELTVSVFMQVILTTC